MATADEATRELVRQFIQQNFILEEGAAFADDDSFVEQGIIDSTGILELVLFVEQTFGLRVPDQDITPANLDSVNKLCAYVARRCAQTPMPSGAPRTFAASEAL